MKYIITETQYKKLIFEQESPTSSGYGQIQSTTTAAPSSGFEYGKIQRTSSPSSSATTATTNSTQTSSSTKVFKEKEEKTLSGSYVIKNMVKTDNNYLEVDLGSLKIYTDCGKLPKGDTSFKYGNSNLYSKDLAIKVGEKFGCKFGGQ